MTDLGFVVEDPIIIWIISERRSLDAPVSRVAVDSPGGSMQRYTHYTDRVSM